MEQSTHTLETNLHGWSYDHQKHEFTLDYDHKGQPAHIQTTEAGLLNLLNGSFTIETYSGGKIFTPVIDNKPNYSQTWLPLEQYMEEVFSDEDAFRLAMYHHRNIASPVNPFQK